MWSAYIDRLTAILTKRGCPVRLSPDLDVSGRCHYAHDPGGPFIEINEPRAKEALCVLAHEAGHLACSSDISGYHKFSERHRETLADRAGFLILMALDAPISHVEYTAIVAPSEARTETVMLYAKGAVANTEVDADGECFSLAALEAIAAGKPLAVYREGRTGDPVSFALSQKVEGDSLQLVVPVPAEFAPGLQMGVLYLALAGTIPEGGQTGAVIHRVEGPSAFFTIGPRGTQRPLREVAGPE